MIDCDPHAHIDEESNGKGSQRLNISRVPGVIPDREPNYKENACGCPHCSFVEDRDVDALNFFTELWRISS